MEWTGGGRGRVVGAEGQKTGALAGGEKQAVWQSTACMGPTGPIGRGLGAAG